MLQVLDASAARRWAVHALAALGAAREEIDALNVFPVPDGDTGTNLYLTLEAAVSSAAAVPVGGSVAEVAEAFAHGALLGARGNSGVIGAQLLRGWADTLAEHTALDAAAAVEGFRRADEQAWQAVHDPVEGTMLSVSRAAARAAAAAPRRLGAVVDAASASARQALALTQAQLPVLAGAGVVDAGGRGLVVLLDSLADLVAGGSRRRAGRGHRHPALPAVQFGDRFGAADDGSGEEPSFEVMYLLAAQDADIPPLRIQLAALGDSIVVIGGAGLWNVHLHTADVGGAIEAGLLAGRPHRIQVRAFGRRQIHDRQTEDRQTEVRQTQDRQTDGRQREGRQAQGLPPTGRRGSGATLGRSTDPTSGPAGSAGTRGPGSGRVGLVAAAAGPGLAAVFQAAGAVTVASGPGTRPSTGDLLAAVRATGATDVVLLPNDGDTLAAAQVASAVARRDGIRVSVLPTRAQVQGLAAAAVHDPSRNFDDDVVSMSAAAGAARDGALTIAVRDALTTAGPCRAGDVLGVIDGDFAVVGSSPHDVALEVVERLLTGGGELLTLVVGTGGHQQLADSLAEHLHGRYRHVEVQVLDGGQSRYPLLVGVE